MNSFLTRAALASTAAAALLAGCAAPGSGSGASGAAARDPLLDAPYHSETTCTTERPVTVLSRVKETPFACADLGVSATLDELRDAGWRVVSLDIGGDVESEKHVGFPVTVMIRKLF
ncbi:hypothetical protein [Sutterella sp.]|uniref:hypothetical protein n=1 Tax=Sutterella sp. TaxID=1981025 RepID=UPI0026DF2FB9|nr:hypothetical protein [Sutterella sp.]MDO5530630.1 hypothetical protein [Sutterella sp.]